MRSITTSVDDVVAALDEHGYAVVENLLPAPQLEAARQDMRRVLAGTPGGRNLFEGAYTKRVYALFAKTRAFDGPATDPLVLGVLDRVLGHCQLSAPTGIEIGPGEVAQILHHDDAIYPLPRPHDEVVLNTMWALDDFTEANGATRVVPGSHRWVHDKPDADTPTVAAEMPAGSVLFYLGSLWHGGGANTTDRARLGVILEYLASWLRPQENHFLAVPGTLVAQLPERLQELLGYNIRPPFMGYVDGRHPRKALGADTT
ncbi:MAG TPA: phytanoyl-CoA dioxygenase family protein [Acidimicrobiales bacterium]|nr:phytanoyl-CoA dioxygenase family protein [Acidimicrobiales bacterium]